MNPENKPLIIRVPKEKPPFPHDVTIGSGTVTIYEETWQKGPKGEKVPALRYKLYWSVGKETERRIKHDWREAYRAAATQANLLNSADRPPTADHMQRITDQASLYRTCVVKLKPFNVLPETACDTLADAYQRMGIEGFDRFVKVYGPRLQKTEDKPVKDLVTKYCEVIFETRDEKGAPIPKTANEKRKHRILTDLVKKFGEEMIGGVQAQPLLVHLEEGKPQEDAFNKRLYCVRGFFVWARDFPKALPKGVETEPELIDYKEVPDANPQIFPVPHIARLYSKVMDRDMVLALFLPTRYFLRQEECMKIQGEHFIRGADGLPIVSGR